MNSMIVPEKKRCIYCGKEKPANNFYAAKECLLGRRPECKKCSNAYHNEWARSRYQPKTGRRYDKSPERQLANRLARERRGVLRRKLDEEIRSGVKVCRECGESKGLDCYKQVKCDPLRYDATCKKCRAAQARRIKKGVRQSHALVS